MQIEWIQCQDHDEAKHHWGLTYLHERDGKPFHWGKLKIHEAQLRTESPVSPRVETQIERASIYGVTL